MSDAAISATGLGKRYRIGRRPPGSLRDALTEGAAAWFERSKDRLAGRSADPRTVWALKDVSFEVQEGEVVGVVGANGAGKSTLLKILCRVTGPTEGRAVVRGRVGSLLEVGTGFQPDLTGRENVFLNGALIGMRRAEIVTKFDEIVAFAEVGAFLDTPVKHYSSGMYLRLAFAVAAHLETDILLIDEVLAVGDVAFQQKCLARVSAVARAGRTVLFVSHSMVAIEDLCSRALWIDRGRLERDDRPRAVIAEYLRRQTRSATEREWPDRSAAPGNHAVRLRAARVRPAVATPGQVIDVGTEFLIEIEYWQLEPNDRVTVSVFVHRQDGLLVFNTGTLHPTARTPGLYREVGRVPGNLMNDGFYSISLDIVHGQRSVFRHEHLMSFTIADRPDHRAGWFGEWPGAVRPILDWRSDLLEPVLTPRVP